MAGLSYEESIKKVYFGLGLLGAVTLVEVAISLFGKGYLIGGVDDYKWVVFIAALIIVILSAYKAYYIIYEFMHMRYEVKSLAYTVLLPSVLLIWALIAFFQEGDSWKNRREYVKEKDAQEIGADKMQGSIINDETYILELNKG